MKEVHPENNDKKRNRYRIGRLLSKIKNQININDLKDEQDMINVYYSFKKENREK